MPRIEGEHPTEKQVFPTWRVIYSRALNVPFPTKIEENNNLNLVEQYLKEGYGMVGMIPHFSYTDFAHVLSALIWESRSIRERPMVIPIAEHQYHTFGLKTLAKTSNITLSRVITPDTKKVEAKLRAAGKHIPWDTSLPIGSGRNEYLADAAKNLGNGGIVILSPQGGRKSTLEPWSKKPSAEHSIRPVYNLLQATEKAGVEKFGFFLMSLEIPNTTNYKEKSGANMWEPYLLKFGDVLTADELRQTAADNNWTPDEELHALMLRQAPLGYIPETLRQ